MNDLMECLLSSSQARKSIRRQRSDNSLSTKLNAIRGKRVFRHYFIAIDRLNDIFVSRNGSEVSKKIHSSHESKMGCNLHAYSARLNFILKSLWRASHNALTNRSRMDILFLCEMYVEIHLEDRRN